MTPYQDTQETTTGCQLVANLQTKPPVVKEILSSDWFYSRKKKNESIISWFRWIIRGYFVSSISCILTEIFSTIDETQREYSRSTYMNRCLDDGIMVYKYIDIVGTSNTVITDAINNAFEEASKTVKNIKWGELGRVTFRVEEGKKIEYQAEVRIGFEVIRNNEN